jgi:rRNA-processing protein FCF1
VGFLLVLEGAARAAIDRLPELREIQVVAASGSGDDAIVSAVRELTGRCVVVTADRELRRRCEALGASILGPGWLLAQFRR